MCVCVCVCVYSLIVVHWLLIVVASLGAERGL